MSEKPKSTGSDVEQLEERIGCWELLRRKVGFVRWMFTRNFWEYMFEKKDPDYPWLQVMWCRFRGHPYNVVWYNPSGYEPDMHCVNCGDDLG